VLSALSSYGSNAQRIVFLVDEFTYMHEYIREQIVGASFMRQWKALLESSLFSAVLIGQDSMPRFKQEFPNEFGVTHDERITYLTLTAASDLAQKPIDLDGSTRWRGQSVAKLWALTAGSPWFVQIVCDELVRLLNTRGARFITEADLDAVVRTLVSGSRAMTIEKFDPLITAAGESVGLAPRATYLSILTAIAHESAGQAGARQDELPMEVADLGLLIEDMLDREVLVRDQGSRLSIKVGLFESWLRVNRAPMSRP
jgi:hypothetical protein